MSENLEIDVFWSFRSPWSYLATPRLRQWQDNYQLQVNFRPSIGTINALFSEISK